MYLTLSMDLNWFTPEDAKNFVDLAIKNKFLIKKGEGLLPSFDIKTVTVPVGFFPSNIVFKEKEIKIKDAEENILSKIVKQIAKKSEISEDDIYKKIKDLSNEKNITQEIAALLIGKEYQLSYQECYKEIEEKFFL